MSSAPAPEAIEAGKSPLALRAAPNPFNPRVVLSFVSTGTGPARLEIFDVRGRLVARQQGEFPAGEARLLWDGRDSEGRPQPTGVYLARVRQENLTDSRKILLAR